MWAEMYFKLLTMTFLIQSFYSPTSEPVLTHLIYILDYYVRDDQRDHICAPFALGLFTVINPTAYDEH